MARKIFIASDHAGVQVKQEILNRFRDWSIIDLGPVSTQSTDYPDWADRLAAEISADPTAAGILVCGSGIGMCIRANRYPKVRAAMAWDTISARLSREHNNANVICLGARLLPNGLMLEIIETFLNTEFAGGRHQGRVEKLEGPLLEKNSEKNLK